MKILILLISICLLSGCASKPHIASIEVEAEPEIVCKQVDNGYECEAIEYQAGGKSDNKNAYLLGQVAVKFIFWVGSNVAFSVAQDQIVEYYKSKFNKPPQQQYTVRLITL
jgi:hypothetical protein